MHRSRSRRAFVAVVATTVATTGVAAIAAGTASASYPVNWSFPAAVATGSWLPDLPPAGANDWGCHPGSAHPDPVVLIHGTLENENDNWQALAPTLANAGYCIYTFTYGRTWYSGGIDGVADIFTSAQQLGGFIGQVRAATGAAKVDLVGHSQGGMLPRVYLKYDGGAANVRRIVGLAPDNGVPGVSGWTAFVNLFPGAQQVIDAGCPACSQQTTPSFYTNLNAGGETDPGVLYTVIATTHDELVTPAPAQSFLPAGRNVTDETVQGACPNDPVGHGGLPYDADAVAMVLNALDPAHRQPVSCSSGYGL